MQNSMINAARAIKPASKPHTDHVLYTSGCTCPERMYGARNSTARSVLVRMVCTSDKRRSCTSLDRRILHHTEPKLFTKILQRQKRIIRRGGGTTTYDCKSKNVIIRLVSGSMAYIHMSVLWKSIKHYSQMDASIYKLRQKETKTEEKTKINETTGGHKKVKQRIVESIQFDSLFGLTYDWKSGRVRLPSKMSRCVIFSTPITFPVFSWMILWRKHQYLLQWTNDWLIDWLKGWLIDWMVDWLIEWLIDWWNSWLIDGMVDWLIEWLGVMPNVFIKKRNSRCFSLDNVILVLISCFGRIRALQHQNEPICIPNQIDLENKTRHNGIRTKIDCKKDPHFNGHSFKFGFEFEHLQTLVYRSPIVLHDHCSKMEKRNFARGPFSSQRRKKIP